MKKFKPIGKKKAKKILSKLKSVHESATMKNASFNQISGPEDYPTNEAEVTEFIKHRTRHYRASWPVAPLEALIKELSEMLAEE